MKMNKDTRKVLLFARAIVNDGGVVDSHDCILGAYCLFCCCAAAKSELDKIDVLPSVNFHNMTSFLDIQPEDAPLVEAAQMINARDLEIVHVKDKESALKLLDDILADN